MYNNNTISDMNIVVFCFFPLLFFDNKYELADFLFVYLQLIFLTH